MGALLRVTWIANAGIKIDYGGRTLLVDAIYEDEGHPFSKVPAALQESLFNGGAPFSNVDYLLFTHRHPDHFSPKKTELFLRGHKVKGVFYPEAPPAGPPPLAELLRLQGTAGIALSPQTGRTAYHIAPEISVCAFPARHMPIAVEKIDKDAVNYCYLLSFGEKQILITADMDYQTETLAWLPAAKLHAVFLTPLFFSALQSGGYFKGALHAERYCIYHIPFPEDDEFGLRKMAASAVSRWPKEKGAAVALLEPMQTITL